jgi:hypothetical protein
MGGEGAPWTPESLHKMSLNLVAKLRKVTGFLAENHQFSMVCHAYGYQSGLNQATADWLIYRHGDAGRGSAANVILIDRDAAPSRYSVAVHRWCRARRRYARGVRGEGAGLRLMNARHEYRAQGTLLLVTISKGGKT